MSAAVLLRRSMRALPSAKHHGAAGAVSGEVAEHPNMCFDGL